MKALQTCSMMKMQSRKSESNFVILSLSPSVESLGLKSECNLLLQEVGRALQKGHYSFLFKFKYHYLHCPFKDKDFIRI